MSVNHFNKLVSLSHSSIHVKNIEEFNSKIDRVIKDGFKNLHVVSDFDKTITKRLHNGSNHLTSFGILAHCPTVPQSYVQNERELKEKYEPLENSITLTHKEKLKYMQEWWEKSENILKGLKVPRSEIDAVVAKLGSSLRDGTKELFNLLYQKGVPLLVFSAGLGDVVESILKHEKLLLPNVKIISNFLKYNDEGVITGFKHSPIQVYNKNVSVLRDFGYEKSIEDRRNVLLMGDSLGDSTMSEKMAETMGCSLKIGFLDIQVKENLPIYMSAFDAVLVNDETMTITRAILDFLL